MLQGTQTKSLPRLEGRGWGLPRVVDQQRFGREQLFGVMPLGILRLDQLAGQVIVDLGHARGVLDRQGSTLHRRQAEEGEEVVARVGAHLPVIQHVQPGRAEGLDGLVDSPGNGQQTHQILAHGRLKPRLAALGTKEHHLEPVGLHPLEDPLPEAQKDALVPGRHQQADLRAPAPPRSTSAG